MSKWRELKPGEYLLASGVQRHWRISLGKIEAILLLWTDGKYCLSIGSEFNHFDAESPEQAQAAALAWAREILGEAMISAGA